MSSDIYHDFRNKYNEKIIKNLQQSKNNLYQNQMELSDQIEEEEEELNENKETIEKVNIINKLVCSNE